MKKFLKIVLVILILGFIGIIIYNVNILKIGKLDKSNPMTKEEVAELCNKEIANLNYMCTSEIRHNDLQNEIEILYVKNGIMASTINGQPESWRNINEKESIFLYGPIAHIRKLDENEENKRSLKIALTLENLGDTGYEYLGETEFNGRQTIVIRFFEENEFIKLYQNRFYIDKQTGILVKQETYYLNGIILKKVTDVHYEVKFDCVTDEDIKRPNLDGYTVYEV